MTKPLTFAQRCFIRSLRHMAYALACLVVFDRKGAEAHGAASAAWAEAAQQAITVIKAGTPAWMLETIDSGLDREEDLDAN